MEAEAGEPPQVQGQCCVHDEFLASWDYRLPQNQQKRKKHKVVWHADGGTRFPGVGYRGERKLQGSRHLVIEL